jgi:hypothetical protein
METPSLFSSLLTPCKRNDEKRGKKLIRQEKKLSDKIFDKNVIGEDHFCQWPVL